MTCRRLQGRTKDKRICSQQDQEEGQRITQHEEEAGQCIGDSLLRRTDRPVTRAHLENRRVCCLPRTKIWDVDPRLKRFHSGAGKNPLIVLHVGTNDSIRFSMEHIKGDYARLGNTLKEMEAQVIFSGILPIPRGGE